MLILVEYNRVMNCLSTHLIAKTILRQSNLKLCLSNKMICGIIFLSNYNSCDTNTLDKI